MKAELFLLGKRINMAARSRRRWLVAAIYAVLAVLMAAGWFLDHWRETGCYMFFATLFINRLFLGGYYFGGLVKPFNGKASRRAEGISDLQLLLRIYRPEPVDSEYRNDEREIDQRGRAHYLAYQVLTCAFLLLWVISSWKTFRPSLLAWLPVSADLLLDGLILVAILTALTLPQAILLWSEPDMEQELEEPSA
jgi:hypothetical protein